MRYEKVVRWEKLGKEELGWKSSFPFAFNSQQLAVSLTPLPVMAIVFKFTLCALFLLCILRLLNWDSERELLNAHSGLPLCLWRDSTLLLFKLHPTLFYQKRGNSQLPSNIKIWDSSTLRPPFTTLFIPQFSAACRKRKFLNVKFHFVLPLKFSFKKFHWSDNCFVLGYSIVFFRTWTIVFLLPTTWQSIFNHTHIKNASPHEN